MKNKLFMKSAKLLVIVLFAFFFSLSSFKAATIKSYAPNCNSSDPLYKITYNLKNVPGDRIVGCIGLVTIDSTKQGYCIEPGVLLGSGYTTSSTAFSEYTTKYFTSKNKSDKKTKVQQILTFAEDLSGKKAIDSITDKTKIYKAYAAQMLIWEIVSGERANFRSIDSSDSDSDFYSVIKASTKSTNQEVKTAANEMKNEYEKLIAEINATYYNESLGQGKNIFSLADADAKKRPVKLNCNESNCYLKITDPDFQYWKVKSNGGLDVELNKKTNTITITTEEPIDQNNAKKIELSVDANTGTAYFYQDDSKQDVTTIAGAPQSAYLYVYTPKYQLKIVKKSSSDISELNGNSLAGAKFNICTDSTCKIVLNEEPLVTDKNGEVKFNELEMPGEYYVVEVSSPTGYNKETNLPKKVEVKQTHTTDNNSYAIANFTNKAKKYSLIKYTHDKETGKSTILNDGCGTDTYTGPEFEILENGKSLYFKEVSAGNYIYASKDTEGATTKLKTCNGRFNVYTLPKCNYTISETKAPDGLSLDQNPSRVVNVCSGKAEITFTNGFPGIEFQKKNEDGELISGGKFSLQVKVNNVYQDILLKEKEQGYYEYVADLKETDDGATYIILTTDDNEANDHGRAFIEKLPPGEYRIVEKEAPEGYELIEDKDSTAKVTIKDSDKEGYYLVELVNQKANMHGSEDSAELIVTITTGRTAPNYVVIISVLAALLVAVILLRKRFKK